jgi:hypothetical protein
MRPPFGWIPLLLAGCIPLEDRYPEVLPPTPPEFRRPVMSDFEMDRSAKDIYDVSLAYLDEKGYAFESVHVDIWPDLRVRVRVVTPLREPDMERMGKGLANRLHHEFNRNYYIYRPLGHDFAIAVVTVPTETSK